MDQSLVDGAVLGCTFDMCALERNTTTQETYKCNSYETMTTQCYDLFNKNNLFYKINWRDITGCRKLSEISLIKIKPQLIDLKLKS